MSIKKMLTFLQKYAWEAITFFIGIIAFIDQSAYSFRIRLF